jgi:hypothetical protein
MNTVAPHPLAACTNRPEPHNERAAIHVCIGCPVRPECLNRAIAERDVTRPRGGLSRAELRYAMGAR